MSKFIQVNNNTDGQKRFINIDTITKVETVQTDVDQWVINVTSPVYTGYASGGGWTSQDAAVLAATRVFDIETLYSY